MFSGNTLASKQNEASQEVENRPSFPKSPGSSSNSSRYGSLTRRPPLIARPKRDPLSKVKGKFDVKRIIDADGKYEVIVLKHEIYGAVIYQRDPETHEETIDLRDLARAALQDNNMDFFRNLAKEQQAPPQEETYLVVRSIAAAAA